MKFRCPEGDAIRQASGESSFAVLEARGDLGEDNVDVEVALQYNDSYVENLFSFVNNINTIEGGTHLVGFKTALTRTINNYMTKNNLFKSGKMR